MLLKPFLIPRDIIPKKDYGLKNNLNFEGTKKGDEEKKDSLTQVKKEERRKWFDVTEYFSVYGINYVCSLFIEKIHN